MPKVDRAATWILEHLRTNGPSTKVAMRAEAPDDVAASVGPRLSALASLGKLDTRTIGEKLGKPVLEYRLAGSTQRTTSTSFRSHEILDAFLAAARRQLGVEESYLDRLKREAV
jgi:hypothetical protein